MAEAALVNEKLEAGEWLVRAADGKKVPLRAALWVYDSGETTWTLVLEEKQDAKLGLREFARALHDAVDSMKNETHRSAARDLLLRDVAVFTQPHPIAQLLRHSLGKARSVSRTRLSTTMVEGHIVDGAILYRLEPSQTL